MDAYQRSTPDWPDAVANSGPHCHPSWLDFFEYKTLSTVGTHHTPQLLRVSFKMLRASLVSSQDMFRPNLPDNVLFNEKMWLQGALLSSVSYGGVVLLSLDVRTAKAYKSYFVVYVLALFSMATLFQACNSKFTELAFIDNRMYPDGPAAYENDFWSIPVNAAGNVVAVLANWSTDGLLLWRFTIIYRHCRVPQPILLILPCLAGLGSIVMGCLFLVQLFKSNVLEASVANINWTLPYFGLTLTLNIFLSFAIVGRLILFRFRISKVLGKAYGSHYTSVASIIIESACFHAWLALLFIIPNALGHPIAIIFLQLIMPDQASNCFASLLIIFRVAQGQAWSSNTFTMELCLTNGSRSGQNGSRDRDIVFDVQSTRVGANEAVDKFDDPINVRNQQPSMV
ncbi:hypothetical protein DL96DRAFT_1604455 [Flagelloscypha sp. PMI_526]|nr:hypothetical protein DL96DRAFT_1604455 [Flagelloscypha sp. PMI_526]